MVLSIAVGCDAACGGSSSPATPSGNAPTAASTFALSGRITSASGGPIAGATVLIGDGPNANRSTQSDAGGSYSLTNLTQSAFTLLVSAPSYWSTSSPISLTSNQTLNMSLAPLEVNLVGTWSGTVVSSGPGISNSCAVTWLITTQVSGLFTGTYQVSGDAGCSESGVIGVAITTSNSVLFLMTGATTGNGTGCTDNGMSTGSTSGTVTARAVTVERSFTRTCPGAAPFTESQTWSLTKQ
jgi:hypothetical protein